MRPFSHIYPGYTVHQRLQRTKATNSNKSIVFKRFMHLENNEGTLTLSILEIQLGSIKYSKSKLTFYCRYVYADILLHFHEYIFLSQNGNILV